MAMKISTKGRYALRLMLDLALHDTGEYIPLKEVAARQEISDKYLEQIITQLSRAGFVKSVRGAQGGYRLAESPAQYTVGRILRLMEGSLAPVECVDGEGDCSRADRCVTIEVWARPEGGHRQRGGFYHLGRSRGKVQRTGRGRLLHLKKSSRPLDKRRELWFNHTNPIGNI